MQIPENAIVTSAKRTPWNKGKLTGAKPPLRGQARLVHPNEAPSRGPQTGPGALQSGHR